MTKRHMIKTLIMKECEGYMASTKRRFRMTGENSMKGRFNPGSPLFVKRKGLKRETRVEQIQHHLFNPGRPF